ncbi:hypothetical protein SEA_PICKLES13_62 [Microbacterium phage Pickles13]|nr:hypothetical protein SEA_PICKLES13_62 [Microbacterium phage Pickles13]
MSVQISADVVLAALREIGAGLADRETAHAVRISNARHRLAGLIDRIENQAVTSESRVTDLEGATLPPFEGHIVGGAGEFAALWNTLTDDQREGWVRNLGEAAAAAQRCVMRDHESAVEMQRRAFVSSVDLEHWARRLRRFAEVWRERPQNGPTIYSLGVMEGEGEARHEVTHEITVDDLLTAAALAQHLAHERIDHAVIFGVHHWANATADIDIVSVDGRVLIEYSAIEALLTETGWTER